MVVVFDLDDTLYAEMDYVRSAYRAISRRYGNGLLAGMLDAPTPRDAFDSTGLPVGDLIEIYRTHEPEVRLPWTSLYVLSTLKNSRIPIGLITDGRSVTQRHKIEALGLERFISPEMIYVSEEIGFEKKTGEAFRRIMNRYGDGEIYIYVGDNPEKDFLPGNELGWDTVCLIHGKGDENLFVQDFNLFPVKNWPKRTIRSLLELLDLENIKDCVGK